jgi:uncharacterized protein (DUF952 family)
VFSRLETIRKWAAALYAVRKDLDHLTIDVTKLANEDKWCKYTKGGEQSYPMLFGLEYEGYDAHFTLTPYSDGDWDYFHITATAYGQNHVFYQAVREEERTGLWVAHHVSQLVQNDKLINSSEHYKKATKVFGTDVDHDVSKILDALEDKGCCT